MQVFSQHADSFRHAGFAVIPLDRNPELGEDAGKKPHVSGFNNWRRRPGAGIVERWRQRYADDNLGYLPGQSGVVVVDDDGGAREKIQEHFGDTPGRVRTARGEHFLYAAPRKPIHTADLRKFGINADLKTGNSIVVAPPSVHRTGAVYAWIDCDPNIRSHLPPFNLAALEKLTKPDTRPASQAELKTAANFPSASRKLALNNYLCGAGADSEDELLAIACDWNQTLPTRGINPLTDTEVVHIANTVWKDFQSGKVEHWHRSRGILRSTRNELHELLNASRNGVHAFALLMELRSQHTARCKRGETFQIQPTAMKRKNVLPGMSRPMIEKARDVLIDEGKIKIVRAGYRTKEGCVTPQYTLPETINSP